MIFGQILYLYFLASFVKTQLPDFEAWPFPLSVTVKDVAASPFDGYIYAVGFTYVKFNNQSLSSGQYTAGFLTCLDLDGNFIWTKLFGNYSSMTATTLTIDSITGDIYVAGSGNALVPGGYTSYLYPFVGRFLNSGDMIFMNFFITYNYYSGPTVKKIRNLRYNSKVYAVVSGIDYYYTFLKIFDEDGNLIATNDYLPVGSADGLAVGNNLNEIYLSQTVTSTNAYTSVQALFSNLTLNFIIQSPHDAQTIYFSNDKIFIAGQMKENSEGIPLSVASQYDVIVSRYDLYGKGRQSAFFGGDNLDTPADILIHPTTGDIYVCGFTISSSIANSPNHGSNDGFVAKLDSNLNLIWVQLFGWYLYDSALTMSLHPNGKIYMTAQMNSSYFGIVSFDTGINPPSTPAPSPPPPQQNSGGSGDIVYQTDSLLINNMASTTTLKLVSTSSAKTTSHTSTSGDNPNFSSSFSLSDISPYALMAIGAFIVIFILFFIFIFYFIAKRILFRNENKSKETEITEMKLGQLNVADISMVSKQKYISDVSSADIGTFYDQTTAVGTVHELSIPLFLELDYEKDVKVGQTIAKGGMGEIFHCEPQNSELIERSQKQKLVLKSVQNKSIEEMTERVRKAFFQELSIMWRFRDLPMFVKVYGYTTVPKATMILKFYPLGSLEDFIHHHSRANNLYRYSKKAVLHTLRWFCGSIHFMHQSGFVHLDIKPANVLLDQMANGYFLPVLTDFGIAQVVDKEQAQVVSDFEIAELRGASLCYAAPEVLKNLKNRMKQGVESRELVFRKDVYSIGAMLFHILTRQTPWFSQLKK